MAYPRIAVKKVTASLPIPVQISVKEKVLYDTDEDGYGEAIIQYDGKQLFKFYFSASEVPFCCGVIEFGDFNETSSNKRNSPDGVITVTHEKKVSVVKELIKRMLEVQEGRTVIINLINEAACNLVKEALTGSRMFTNVKTFTNPGSKREISMWISNNG